MCYRGHSRPYATTTISWWWTHPPALQVRTLNAIAAANDAIIPCTADASAVAGMQAVIDCVDEMVEVVRGAEPRVAGIVVTRHDARNSLEPEMFDKIAKIAA